MRTLETQSGFWVTWNFKVSLSWGWISWITNRVPVLTWWKEWVVWLAWLKRKIGRTRHHRNIRVQVDPLKPLLAGSVLKMDNGVKQWMQCWYEQVFKLCTKCRMIGHERLWWTLEVEVERMLHAQRLRLTELHGVQFKLEATAAHFSNEMMAFYNRQRRHTTQPSKHGGSVAISNCLYRSIGRRRGIRRGDPLSPYLFILYTNVSLVLFLMVNRPRPSVASK